VSRWLLSLVLALAACDSREVRIEVAIPGPDSIASPVANLPLVLLSYDRDSIIRLLEARAPSPAKITRRLDTLFAAFRGPFQAYATASLSVAQLQDSLTRLKATLDTLPRSGADYARLYRRFAALADSLSATTRRRDLAQAGLKRARDTLSTRIDSLRGLMSRWQDSTYAGYDSIVGELNNVVGRQPIPDTTGVDGSVTIALPNGDWWVYATSWDAEDPNAEWYWNIPVKGKQVVLDRRSGTRRPRY
jgi:hypothetical protein